MQSMGKVETHSEKMLEKNAYLFCRSIILTYFCSGVQNAKEVSPLGQEWYSVGIDLFGKSVPTSKGYSSRSNSRMISYGSFCIYCGNTYIVLSECLVCGFRL